MSKYLHIYSSSVLKSSSETISCLSRNLSDLWKILLMLMYLPCFSRLLAPTVVKAFGSIIGSSTFLSVFNLRSRIAPRAPESFLLNGPSQMGSVDLIRIFRPFELFLIRYQDFGSSSILYSIKVLTTYLFFSRAISAHIVWYDILDSGSFGLLDRLLLLYVILP